MRVLGIALILAGAACGGETPADDVLFDLGVADVDVTDIVRFDMEEDALGEVDTTLPCVLPDRAEKPLVTPTYDGSGQAMHPDVTFFPLGWNGYEYWMAMTPYPGNNDDFENPSILVSSDGLVWEVPPSLTNPLDSQFIHHNCDPDLVYSPTENRFYIFYLDGGSGTSYLKMMLSENGTTWSTPFVVLQRPDFILSPAVIYQNGKFQMWLIESAGSTVSASRILRLESTNPTQFDYATAQDVALTLPNHVPWHLNVMAFQKVAGVSHPGYLMLLTAFATGTSSLETVLFAAYSEDGLSFVPTENPIINIGPEGEWDSQRIHRSSAVYHEASDILEIWYGAQRKGQGWDWHTGYTSMTLGPFLNGCFKK